LVVSSGNHDGDNRNVGDESFSQWIRDAKADRLFVDGDSVEFSGIHNAPFSGKNCRVRSHRIPGAQVPSSALSLVQAKE
jgi:hypothetical protein